MRDALKKLVSEYMLDALFLEGTRSEIDEEIDAMADHFVDDVERLLSARKDFRDGNKEG